MKAHHPLRTRTVAFTITTLTLLAIPVLGGCSVSGGVSGSVGGHGTGAHFGVNVDAGIYDGTEQPGDGRRYRGETVYVVPNRQVSP